MRPCLILGGAGNFGKRIAAALIKAGVPVILGGRTREKLEALKGRLNSPLVDIVCFDAFGGLDDQLNRFDPSSVVNTVGPFQTRDYSLAEQCIGAGVHYIDLADGRAFVTNITALDAIAIKQGIAVISGASTVPALSSAVVSAFKNDFSKIEDMTFGIAPGQKAERGLATTQGILSYVGKPLRPFRSQKTQCYGWQDLYRQHYPGIGYRWMANCDIPDLDLIPEHYDIDTIRFSAGLELGPLHLGLWLMSWLVRFGLPLHLPRFAKQLLSLSNIFDRFGSADGGMHVILKGQDHSGKPLVRQWFIIAHDGYGPHIPTIPAIIFAKRSALGTMEVKGAMPCMGLVTLDEYLAELDGFPIKTFLI